MNIADGETMPQKTIYFPKKLDEFIRDKIIEHGGKFSYGAVVKYYINKGITGVSKIDYDETITTLALYRERLHTRELHIQELKQLLESNNND